MPVLSKVADAGEGSKQTSKEGLFGLPVELFDEITSYLKVSDLCHFKFTSRDGRIAIQNQWHDAILLQTPIYSTYESMKRFLSMLQEVKGLAWRVKALELVSEGLKLHEYGSEWAWEYLTQWEQVDNTAEDVSIINKINADHALAVEDSNGFLHMGGYRILLEQIIAACPELTGINIRKLKIDEHIPDWTDTAKFKDLSYYRPGLAIKPIFYGDWQYDTLHHRVTHYRDEFGDDIIEPNAGPQAKFIDDVDAAILASGKTLSKNFIR
ncbi:hypothetical protein BDU57DRAFT_521494 [Ampelomyces quisqualis]|uniref:F-box domain-containing protein n=1 Tax=Ampelomyces quisqualis TaxID=50730 RepID=A0A6A5QFI2_AMPQU|nr:hypothetical protein BDU57DRAFT_521494 [Ampelomyces quisqualis]